MNRDDFPILKEHINGNPLVYLDNAATTQKPQQVIDAICYAYTHFNANIHRAVHTLANIATTHHEEARQAVADFLNANNSREIIFTKGTTDSINLLARSFAEKYINQGDEVIISYYEHHSNIVPWQMIAEHTGAKLRVIPLKDDLSLDFEAYKQLINEKTKLVSVTYISNVLGVELPVKEIICEAHKYSIPVLIDAAQAAPHKKIDVQQLDCDFLALSVHKMYGPTGIGILYGKEQWLENLPPIEGGGEMIEHVSFDKTTYNELPYKFEAGTPNFIGSYATKVAIDYINTIGLDNIFVHEQNLTQKAIEILHSSEGVKIYADSLPKHSVLSFNVFRSDGKLIHPFDIATLLDQQGVALRSGHHCAEPLINFLQTTSTLRLSFGLYNTEEDIYKFENALRRATNILKGTSKNSTFLY